MKRRRPRYFVQDVSGSYTYQDEPKYMTLAQARKQLATEAREARERCKKSHKRCSIVGKARDGHVEIRIGGKQGYHMWTRIAIKKLDL